MTITAQSCAGLGEGASIGTSHYALIEIGETGQDVIRTNR